MTSFAARRAAVLGSPIAHSLSPVLHRAAYAELGLNWAYDAVEVREPDLAPFLDRLDATWAGLSLTMPLKRAVLPLLTEVSPLARSVGAANTVIVQPDGKLCGDNTDVPGMVAALREAGVETVFRGGILGGGATACSAAAALRELGARALTVAVRDPARAGRVQAYAEEAGIDVALVPWSVPTGCDVLVATTPAGSTDALRGTAPIGAIAVGTVLFDVVYDPWPTPLASAWSLAGGRVVSGFELLLHQAALQVALMTGRQAPLATMRAAGSAVLASRTAHAG